MSEGYETYAKLLYELWSLRAQGVDESDVRIENVLDRMDKAWYPLSDEERTAVEQLSQELREESVLEVSPEAFMKIVELIQNPPEPPQKLRDLLARHR